MIDLWLNRIKRGMQRSPGELRRRIVQEGRAMLDRYRVAPAWAIDDGRFAQGFGCGNIEELWEYLSSRPFPAFTGNIADVVVNGFCPGESERIKSAAKLVHDRQVSFLGAGPEQLSDPILWDADFNTDDDWPDKFFRDIDILNPSRKSDVKIPWELSRLQWLMPAGQSYMMTGSEEDAALVRNTLLDWIEQNPYGRGVNWTVAMEAAMRIFTWTWFFHVFKSSKAWDSYEFRSKFLKSLYEQAVFCQRYLEDYGNNGNHCTADGAALVFAGLFFGTGLKATQWQSEGWSILNREMPLQVLGDGVDFEGSTAYHRFVTELFLWPALYRRSLGLDVPKGYSDTLKLMAEFIRNYTKPDGSAPLWGDNDDGRVLPFGGQEINDHTYLPDMISQIFNAENDNLSSPQSRSEILWAFGELGAKQDRSADRSAAFREAGVFIMAGNGDHVFIDCGPVGYGGRGGHGHNDCLSFEAMLDGTNLLTDGGSYVYSASYQWRNRFRATASHNTPMIDEEEQNRFLSDAELFSLHDDAKAEVREWRSEGSKDIFVGAHSGYRRLADPITPVRSIVLDKDTHRLAVTDRFEAHAGHDISVPFHFCADCELEMIGEGVWRVSNNEKDFRLVYSGGDEWWAEIGDGWVSPQYGVKTSCRVLTFTQKNGVKPLRIGLYPLASAPKDPIEWLNSIED